MPDYPWLRPAWDQFQARLKADRLAHALMLHGPSGTGKAALAHAMVAMLLCLEPGSGQACGRCRSCALLVSGAHPDRFHLRPKEDKHQILIDDVRETVRSLSFTTTISQRKVALFEPAEAMNRNAANALLKCLEEPPGDAVLLLVAHDPSRLPVTIRSRCQALTVSMPAPEAAADWLMETASTGLAQAQQALAAAGGSPLRALALVQQDLVGVYQRLREQLDGLLDRSTVVPAVAGSLSEIEANTLWLWLSGLAAERLRAAIAGHHNGRALARLQQLADRNRRLARTPVRADLLLRDWLIEWTEAAHEQR